MKKVKRVLLSNDDGIEAEGLSILEDIAQTLAEEVWVCAPLKNCSGAGRSLTLKEEFKASNYQGSSKRYVCDGTPADCVVFAINHLLQDGLPDLMLSGINLGMNIADDVTCSGTIGAAWEAAVYGIPSIALSQKFNTEISPDPTVFNPSKSHAKDLIESLLEHGIPSHVVMNINFPYRFAHEKVLGIKSVGMGCHKVSDEILPGSEEGIYRIGKQRKNTTSDDSDFGALNQGYITLSPLSLDMTDYALVKELDGLKI